MENLAQNFTTKWNFALARFSTAEWLGIWIGIIMPSVRSQVRCAVCYVLCLTPWPPPPIQFFFPLEFHGTGVRQSGL